MNNLLFGISLAALFSTTSLFIVLLRVSPLTAPVQALPAFFASLFLTVSSISALLFIALWHWVTIHTWDMGKILSISIRQGLLTGGVAVLIVLFHLLSLLNWWITLMIIGVAILVELAMDH